MDNWTLGLEVLAFDLIEGGETWEHAGGDKVWPRLSEVVYCHPANKVLLFASSA
jgi:hypothetical protein